VKQLQSFASISRLEAQSTRQFLDCKDSLAASTSEINIAYLETTDRSTEARWDFVRQRGFVFVISPWLEAIFILAKISPTMKSISPYALDRATFL
jgi:hypothetical protein